MFFLKSRFLCGVCSARSSQAFVPTAMCQSNGCGTWQLTVAWAGERLLARMESWPGPKDPMVVVVYVVLSGMLSALYVRVHVRVQRSRVCFIGKQQVAVAGKRKGGKGKGERVTTAGAG